MTHTNIVHFVLAAAFIVGCGKSRNDTTGASPQSTNAGLTDGQIVAVNNALNSGEVNAAVVALGHVSSAAIRDFAAKMQREHSAAMQDDLRLGIMPEATKRADDVDAAGKSVILLLNASAMNPPSDESCATSLSFDCIYVRSQVEMHTTALELIDNELIPAADDDDLADFLQKERDMVAGHLEQAQQLAR